MLQRQHVSRPSRGISAWKWQTLAALLLGACALAPEAPAPAPQKYGGWVDQYHEPRGQQECKEHGVAAGAAYNQCIHGWHERIWVEDMAAPGTPSPNR